MEKRALTLTRDAVRRIHFGMPLRQFGIALLLLALFAAGCQSPCCDRCGMGGTGGGQVALEHAEGRVRVSLDGQLFTEYHYQNVSRPFLFPILGPGSVKMTRSWPMSEAPNEERDHPHHRSLWYTHGSINGQDFWSESAKAGRTVHERFLKVASGRKSGMLHTANKLVARDGAIVATDERLYRFSTEGEVKIIDVEITVIASHGPLTFGDTKEGSMAIRLAETMRLKGKVGQGHIVNSEGIRDGETWGKRARWVDYYGPVEGKTVGVAMFDHPSNPRHPTWWHVRDYGLFAANPFGIHDFEKKPAGTGDLKIRAGEKVTWKYRILFHPGNEQEARIAERYQAYAGSGHSH